MDYERESATGMPLLRGQACLARAVLTQESSGEVLGEVMALSNLVIWWDRLPGTEYFVGGSRICSAQVSRHIVDDLFVPMVEHVTTCEGEACGHAGLSMELVDCA